MEIFKKLGATIIDSFSNYGEQAARFIPVLVVALVVLLVGWLLAKFVARIILKMLTVIKLDEVVKKVGLDKLLSRIKPGLSFSLILSKIIYWFIMLIVITTIADILGLDMVKDALAAFFAYLPTLMVALLIFIVGIYIADLIKNMIYTAANSIGISGAMVIANIVYYILFIFIAITALNEAGVDTSIITNNVTIILGSILLAFALSYGIASRGLVSNMLSSYYGKGRFKEGQTIRVKGVQGKVYKIDSISVTIDTGNSKIVLPSKTLIEEQVEILNEASPAVGE